MRLLFALLMLFCFATSALADTAAAVIPTPAKGIMMAGGFQKSHTYKLAYYTASAAFTASTAQYTSANEVTGTGYTAGGVTLSGLTYGTSGTTYWIDFADPAISGVTLDAPYKSVMIYNASLSNTACSALGTPYPCCTGSNAGTCTNAALYVGPTYAADGVTVAAGQPVGGTLTGVFPAADATHAIVRGQ